MTVDIVFKYDAQCSLCAMDMATGSYLLCEYDPEWKVLMQNSCTNEDTGDRTSHQFYILCKMSTDIRYLEARGNPR